MERQFSCVQQNISRVMYQIAPMSAEETESSKKLINSQGSMTSFLHFIGVQGHNRKNTNAFGISRASVSGMISFGFLMLSQLFQDLTH